MASNKKSGLTGYLPDILMAAAAVRLRLLPCPARLASLVSRLVIRDSHLFAF
jgi:hypothetical protein